LRDCVDGKQIRHQPEWWSPERRERAVATGMGGGGRPF
jgi:hypothetical protein